MPVFNPRNRLVNFRLSDDEFEQLRASSAVSGARSLSDFARSAVMRCAAEVGSVESTAPGAASGEATTRRANPPSNDISNKVFELETRVTELVGLIEALKQHGTAAGVEAPAEIPTGEKL